MIYDPAHIAGVKKLDSEHDIIEVLSPPSVNNFGTMYVDVVERKDGKLFGGRYWVDSSSMGDAYHRVDHGLQGGTRDYLQEWLETRYTKQEREAKLKEWSGEKAAKPATSQESRQVATPRKETIVLPKAPSFKRGERVLLKGTTEGQRVTFLKDNGDGTADVQVKTPGANRYMPEKAETRTVKIGDIGSSKIKDVLTSGERAALRQGIEKQGRAPSVRMKDEAAEKLARQQEDDLAALFDTPEFGTMGGDEGKDGHRQNAEPGEVHEHRLRGRPSGLVDKAFHPFSDFLSSHHGVEVDRRNGTPVGIGVVRDAFEAFAPDGEQKALAAELFDVAEKLGVDFRVDHRRPGKDRKNEQGYEIGGHVSLHADELDKRFGKDVCDAILHETAHGVTSYAINISESVAGVEGVEMPHALHDAVRRLRAAFKANRDLLPGDEEYRNLHEFAARLTEPEFRDALKRRGWLRRAVDAVVDMFKALFGKPRTARANPEYDRAVKALRGILENYDKTAFDANRAAADREPSDANRRFLSWAKKWKLDPSKEKNQREWAQKNGIDFDTPEFDPDVFQRRVGAVAKLVKTYRDSGVADFRTLATRMAERFPEKFAAMKPYLRGVWNAVAEQMEMPEVSRNAVAEPLKTPAGREEAAGRGKMRPSAETRSRAVSGASDGATWRDASGKERKWPGFVPPSSRAPKEGLYVAVQSGDGAVLIGKVAKVTEGGVELQPQDDEAARTFPLDAVVGVRDPAVPARRRSVARPAGEVDFYTPGLYTGSAADYERPSLHYVGTGTGDQVYGWGLYASDRRGVAEDYAKTGKDAESVRALYKGRTVDENADVDTHSIASAVEYVAQYPNEASTVEEYFDRHIAAYEGKGVLYKQFADRERRQLKRYLSEKADWSVSLPQEHLYEQTWFTDRAPGDESHLLKWYEPMSEEQKAWIEEQAKKEGFVVGYSIRGEKYIAGPNVGGLATSESGIILEYWQTGEDAYRAIGRLLGSPKAASEFLARAGIDGVKYPVDSYGKAVKDGDEAGWNYVSFRDDNIRVDHKWADGEIQFDTPELSPEGRREHDEVVARYTNADGTKKPGWMKAPNGKPTRLTERQWAQVRTPSFKKWFGDWEGAATLSAIESLSPVVVADLADGFDVKAAYAALEDGRNVYDGRRVRFVNSTLGKILRHRGYDTARVVPHLKEVFDAAVPIGFEVEREMQNRKDGRPHKTHRNFVGYHGYLGKIADGGKSYFVRFTVQELKTRSKTFVPNEVHSTFVSDVELYNEADLLALDTAKGAGKVGAVGFVDGIVAKRLADFKGARETSSKVVDENGEPRVVYHGHVDDFTVFKPSERGKLGKGVYLSAYKEKAGRYSRIKGKFGYGHEKVMSLFVNIRNPYVGSGEIYDEGLRNALTDNSYDGIISDKNMVEIVARNPAQVKSATGNNGDFSRTNPDVNFDTPELAAESHSRSALADIAAGKPYGILHNPKYGVIRYPLGRAGKGGEGFLHIVEHRMNGGASLDDAIDVAIKVGKAAEIGEETLSRYNTHHLDSNGVRAIIAEMPDHTKVITGYEIDADEKAAANRRAAELAPPPHVSSEEVIAHLREIVSQSAAGRNGVSAADDAAYMDAVRRGDMEAAEKMERDAVARAMPDTKVVGADGKPMKVYHGSRTGANIKIFRTPSFFSDNRDVADMFKKEADFILRVNGKEVAIDDVTARQIAGELTGGDYTPDEMANWGSFAESIRDIEDNGKGYGGRDVIADALGGVGIDTPLDEITEMSFMRVPDIYECYVNITNPLEIDFKGNTWGQEGTREMEAAVRDAAQNGYDGVIVRNIREGGFLGELRNGEEPPLSTDYIPVSPNQIKLADAVTRDDAGNVIPLSQRFGLSKSDANFDSPELDPMRRAEEVNTYARRYYERHKALHALERPTRESVMDAAEGRWQKFRRALQDKNLVIREVEERLGVTDKRQSVYYAKDREFGLNEHQLGELQRRRVEPIFDALADVGVGQEALDLYLIARHAPYRNALVRGRNGTENGSGMSDADADAVIGRFRALGVEGELARIADMVYDMNDEALQRLVDSGRLSQEDADGFRAAQADYVPLRTDMEDADRDAFNTSTSGWKKNEFHAAKGRDTLADSPLAWSIVQAERAIKASNANVTRQAAAALVRHAEKIGKPIGEIVPAHRFNKRWAFDIGGEVWTADALKDRPDLIFFKEDGRLKAIKIDGGKNALGVTFAKAVTDKDLVQFSKWFEWVPKLTRAMSAMRTQYVPTFILRNMKADTLEAMLNVFSERGLRPGLSFGKRLLASEWKNRKDVKDYFRTGEARGRMKEFVENGGLTGGGMAAEGFSEAAKRIQNTLKRHGGGARRLAAAVPDAISLLNACAEYNTRLGIYAVLREEGVSVEDAISYARDATVNFNRKGYLTPYTNAAFMFSNAAIQGMGRAFKSMGAKHGKGTLAALFMVGVIQTLLDHWLGDDDDREKKGLSNAKNMTEHDKQTSLGVPLPGGRRLKAQIRNPWALPAYLGRKTAELAMGAVSASRAAKDVASAVGGFITEPVGGNGFDSISQTWQTFAPTLADPLVQWMTGTDFKGDERLRKKWDDNLPSSWYGRRNTASPYKWIAQGLNALSGGGEFRKGAFDTSPENWQLLAETVLGGALTDLNRVASAISDAWDAAHGARPDQVLRDVPFVRDTVTNMPDVSRRYHESFDAYDADRTEFQGVKGADGRLAFAARHPWVMDDRVKRLDKEIRELGKMEQGLEKKGGEWVAAERTPRERLEFRRQRLAKMAEFVGIMEEKPSGRLPPDAEYRILTQAFSEAKKEYDAVEKDPLIDEANKKLVLDSIVSENPLMGKSVRGDVAARIEYVRNLESKVRKAESGGRAPSADFLATIERLKTEIIEKIRSARRGRT